LVEEPAPVTKDEVRLDWREGRVGKGRLRSSESLCAASKKKEFSQLDSDVPDRGTATILWNRFYGTDFMEPKTPKRTGLRSPTRVPTP
jgi:hypothetical protein